MREHGRGDVRVINHDSAITGCWSGHHLAITAERVNNIQQKPLDSHANGQRTIRIERLGDSWTCMKYTNVHRRLIHNSAHSTHSNHAHLYTRTRTAHTHMRAYTHTHTRTYRYTHNNVPSGRLGCERLRFLEGAVKEDTEVLISAQYRAVQREQAESGGRRHTQTHVRERACKSTQQRAIVGRRLADWIERQGCSDTSMGE